MQRETGHGGVSGQRQWHWAVDASGRGLAAASFMSNRSNGAMRADEENDLAGVSPIVRPFAPRAGAGRTEWQPSDSAIDS